MNGPEKFLNPLYKESGASTDPTSHFMKMETPGTDPTSPLMKYSAPGTDAPSFGQADPGPIAMPGGTRTESASGGGAGRGLLGAIIVVCLIGLLGGGVALVPRFFLSAGSQLNPGVIAWEGLGNAKGGAGAGGANGPGTPDVKTFCGPGSSPSSGAHSNRSSLEEHLIGGGFDFRSGSDPSVAAPDNSTSQSAGQHAANWDWRLQLTGGNATSYAICLREPPAFFSPANALDYVVGPVAQHFGLEEPEIASEASCPSSSSSSVLPVSSSSSIAPIAGNILGGGYVLGGSHPPRVNSSYPIVDGSGARWHVSAIGGSGSAVQAFAICSGTMKTHLEHTAMTVKAADPLTFFGDGATSCTSGTLLSGGFHVTDGSRDDFGLGVDIQTNAPGKSLKVNKTTGDTFTDWAVTLNGTTEGETAKSVTGDTWVVCWDPNDQPQATTTPTTSTTQVVPTATPVGVAQPTPTPTPASQPTPTNTPAPQCSPFVSGSGSMNVDNSYLNVEVGSATGIGHLPAGAHVQWITTPAPGAMQPINGAQLADAGVIGAGGFNNLTCAQLTGANYTAAGSASVADGEVFLVKTPAGRYAKVLVSVAVSNPNPTLRWQTYSIS